MMFDTSNAGPWLVFLVFHLVMAACLWKMAERVKEEPKWFALVPLLNAVLFLKIAKKPMWWLILLFVPFVNFIVLIAVTMSICERFGLNKWWGLLAVISPFNLILYLYLAFGHPMPPSPTAPPAPPMTPSI